MRISQCTSHSHPHIPAASHLLCCQIRGASNLCRESLKSSRLRRVVPAKKLCAGFAHVAKSLGKLHTSPRVGKVFGMSLCVRCRRAVLCASVWEEAFKCMHACEHMREETSTMAGRFLPRLPKLLLWLGLRCCQCTVSWDSLQTERLGGKYYLKAYCGYLFTWCVASQGRSVVLNTIFARVCVCWCVALPLSHFLCGKKKVITCGRLSGGHVTNRRRGWLLFLRLFTSFNPLPSLPSVVPPPLPPERPI